MPQTRGDVLNLRSISKPNPDAANPRPSATTATRPKAIVLLRADTAHTSSQPHATPMQSHVDHPDIRRVVAGLGFRLRAPGASGLAAFPRAKPTSLLRLLQLQATGHAFAWLCPTACSQAARGGDDASAVAQPRHGLLCRGVTAAKRHRTADPRIVGRHTLAFTSHSALSRSA